MFPFYASTLAANRTAALEGMLAVSGILFETGERYARLVMDSSRRALELGGRQVGGSGGQPQAVSAQLLEHTKAESTRLLEEAYAIACDTHAALIAAGDSQVQRFDQVVRTLLQRAANWSPWEGAIAFDALRTSLDSAESTIHEMVEVATHTLEIAEKEAHVLAGAGAPAKAPAPTTAKAPAKTAAKTTAKTTAKAPLKAAAKLPAKSAAAPAAAAPVAKAATTAPAKIPAEAPVKAAAKTVAKTQAKGGRQAA